MFIAATEMDSLLPYCISKILIPLLLVGLIASVAFADEVVIKKGNKEITLQGEILEEAQDKSILFQKSNGELLILTADQIKSKVESSAKVPPQSKEEVAGQLLKELPAGFKVRATTNYVIAYQTEDAYAQWIARLYEKRLVPEFEKFAKRKLKTELGDAPFPMVVIVFRTQAEYVAHIKRTLGIDLGNTPAYYNQMSNHIVMYDLTRNFLAGDIEDRPLNEILSRRDAIPMVATIIHEATHQLMHNRGLQTRMTDRPLWISEGLALFFEAPNLENKNGWLRPGLVHYDRLAMFRNFLNTARQPNSIESLIGTDARFHGENSLQAYAESWALVHFLVRKSPKKMAAYLKDTASRPVCVEVDAPQRIAEFKKYFGDNLEKLDRQFLKYVKNLK